MSVKMHDGSDKEFMATINRINGGTEDKPRYEPLRPTRRQYKKWQRREGTAYANRNK